MYALPCCHTTSHMHYDKAAFYDFPVRCLRFSSYCSCWMHLFFNNLVAKDISQWAERGVLFSTSSLHLRRKKNLQWEITGSPPFRGKSLHNLRENILCPGLPPVIAPLITFAAANETTPSLVGEEPTNAGSKLKPSVFVFIRKTDPCCQGSWASSFFVGLLLFFSSSLLLLPSASICVALFERITAFLISSRADRPWTIYCI